MITAEKNLGFNIKTFGPVAAWILIFLISTVLFHTINQIGAGNVTAGSIALVVTYFVMRGLIPQFFELLQKNEYTNWLHSLLFIAVVIAMVKGPLKGCLDITLIICPSLIPITLNFLLNPNPPLNSNILAL